MKKLLLSLSLIFFVPSVFAISRSEVIQKLEKDTVFEGQVQAAVKKVLIDNYLKTRTLWQKFLGTHEFAYTKEDVQVDRIHLLHRTIDLLKDDDLMDFTARYSYRVNVNNKGILIECFYYLDGSILQDGTLQFHGLRDNQTCGKGY